MALFSFWSLEVKVHMDHSSIPKQTLDCILHLLGNSHQAVAGLPIWNYPPFNVMLVINWTSNYFPKRN